MARAGTNSSFSFQTPGVTSGPSSRSRRRHFCCLSGSRRCLARDPLSSVLSRCGPADKDSAVPDVQTMLWIAALVVTAVATFGAIKFLDKLRKLDAENEAKRIVGEAERQAVTNLKEAELSIKEKDLAQKQETEKLLNKSRDELREKERSLDKRQETVGQQTDDLRKQERIVESTQRRLAEKLEEAKGRNEELSKVLDQQRQTLQNMSGLTVTEATRRLMEKLENELQQDMGNAIVKHERRMAEVVEQKSREMLLIAIQRYAAAHGGAGDHSLVPADVIEHIGEIIGELLDCVRPGRLVGLAMAATIDGEDRCFIVEALCNGRPERVVHSQRMQKRHAARRAGLAGKLVENLCAVARCGEHRVRPFPYEFRAGRYAEKIPAQVPGGDHVSGSARPRLASST